MAKRDIFNRGTPRFTMRFGEAEKRDDPLGVSTFQPNFPVFPAQRSGALTAQQLGEHCYKEPRSAVQKLRGGFASKDGPRPDYAGVAAYAIPASTKKRKSP